MPTDTLAPLRQAVARACRILAHRGLSPGVLGHVSARVGESRLLVRCRGPRERGLLFTTVEDIRVLDLDGSADPGGGYAAPTELPLHTEVLRQRPDDQAVVHAHPPAVVAADLAGLRLGPVVGAYNIPALRLALDGIPVYRRGVLIRRRELAAEMMTAMGASPVCLLRAHGLTACGNSVAQAVARALHVDELARLCLAVAQCGAVPADLPARDVAELPDLGSSFNDELTWEHALAVLQQAGLDV